MFAAAYAQKESVELAGEIYDLDEVVRYVDPRLFYEAQEWCGSGATGQAVLTEYLRLHELRYKLPFAMPRR